MSWVNILKQQSQTTPQTRIQPEEKTSKIQSLKLTQKNTTEVSIVKTNWKKYLEILPTKYKFSREEYQILKYLYDKVIRPFCVSHNFDIQYNSFDY